MRATYSRWPPCLYLVHTPLRQTGRDPFQMRIWRNVGRVRAVAEAPGCGVSGSLLPRHEPVAGELAVVHAQLHLRKERVGRVVEALPRHRAGR